MKYFLTALFLALGTNTFAQHTVTLKTGEKIEGELQTIKDHTVSFFSKGTILTFDEGQISSIQFDGPVKSTGATPSGNKAVTYVMPGRKLTRQPKIDNLTMERGIVVVEITINKYGNVMKAEPGGEGTTTTSQYLLTKAKQAAESAMFDGGGTLPLEQKGTITIVF
jgi:hypothetical protein